MLRPSFPRVSLLFFGAALGLAPASRALDLSGNLSDSTTGPIPAGVHRVIGSITVPAGQTLTIQPGAILKFNGGLSFRVAGTLAATGTAGQNIILTSIQDDTGGDTNGDGGATVPGPSSWLGILLPSTSTGTSLDYCDVRYTGWGGWSSIYVEGAGAQATITNSVFRNSGTNGINGNNHSIDLTVTGCSFIGNGSYAVRDVRLDDCPGFTNNVASGNGSNYIYVTQPNPTANVTLTESNCLNGALVFSTTCDVPAGVTLTLQAGVVLKFNGGVALRTAGRLVTQGTVTKPVVITALADDDFGGDTNGDGPSNGGPSTHRGWILAAGSTGSSVDHTIIRYAGWGGWGGLYVEGAGAQATITDSSFRDAGNHGIDANNFPVDLTVTGCSFTGNGSFAVTEVRIDDCQGFTNNTASGNGGNYIYVTAPSPSSHVTIAPENCLEGALVFSTSSVVNAGTSLTLEGGVVVKFSGGATLVANDGAIHLNGVAGNPVVLTAFADDTAGGDTNGDGGASVPGPSSWQGVRFESAAVASSLRHVLIRYTGWGGWYGLRSASPLLDARAVRIEHAGGYGFYASALAYGADWAAWNGSSDGIRLDGGTFVLERCTAANNAGAGIRDVGGFTGVVLSSLAFGNGGGNIVGLANGELRYSNGHTTLAGTDGNINADPLFLDALNGDLRLGAGSPCIETGDPLGYTGAILDMSGITRSLDGDFDKDPRVDMGAYEFSHVRLDVTGTFQLGGTITFTSTGTPGLISYLFLGTDTGALLFYPYGTLLVDPLSSFVFVPWPGPPANPSFVVPGFLPTPQPIAVQQIVFQGSTAGGGNLSNVEYFVIE